MEATPGFEPGVRVLQTLALPLGYVASGAGNGTRTRDPQLGKLMLYQLSYSRSLLSIQFLGGTLWHVPHHQEGALPTELFPQLFNS